MRVLLLLAIGVVVFAGAVPQASAQYMYLDTNGDGVHSTADDLQPNGVPTTVDVWIRTNANRDGSPALCNTQDGDLTINSYVFNLEAVDGTVTYSGFINQQPQWTVNFGVITRTGFITRMVLEALVQPPCSLDCTVLPP